jgi:hypothetical protein
MLLGGNGRCLREINSGDYRSASSSSGSGISEAICISFWYSSRRAWSTVAVGGARAGAATKSCYIVSVEFELNGPGMTYQSWVANKLTSQPKEGLLEVVVGFGGYIVVLEILLSVEGDSLCLHFSLLNINLVSGQDDGDVFADTDQITYIRRVSICD